MNEHFYAMISRMKYIERWSLMRNSITENISEHSQEVAILSHALAVIGNRRFGKHLSAERAALIGLYHDATEIITGDMPTPIKYFNKDINDAFKKVENNAAIKLLNMLPEDFRTDYESIFLKNDEEDYIWMLVKAADKLSALIKCIEEEKTGNREFKSALSSIRDVLDEMNIPEADVFIQEFLPSYYKTLDELK